MSAISHLLDHTTRLWRSTPTLGRTREEVRNYEVVATPRCHVAPAFTPRRLTPGGLAPDGTRVLFLDPEVDVRARDLVELVTGGDAPQVLEVDAVSRPRGHHWELLCRVWNGTLPPEGS